MGFLNEAGSLFKKNIREYGMYIALAAIIAYYYFQTENHIFLSPNNLNTLISMTGYIAVLAVGMTLVIVIRHIDLSVGFVAAFIGAVAAVALKYTHINVWLLLVGMIILGAIIGLFNGFFVAHVGIPAFVVSLAGMLIFHGLLIKTLIKDGTVIIQNETFKQIGSGFIPPLFKFNLLDATINGSTFLIGILAIVLFIYSEISNRKNNLKYNFDVISIPMMIIKMLFITGIVSYFFYQMASYQGLSWTGVIVIVIVAIYYFVTMKTPLGRHIYAVGGNPEAAQLSGINVKKITLIVFASMGALAAIAGILFTTRLNTAAPSYGVGFELDAIAAAYVGGVSAAGGVGKVTGSIIGALVMASLKLGMLLCGTSIDMQYIIQGIILVVAVVFDVMTRNKAK